MDHSRFLKFNTGALLIAIISLTACSSSQVDDPNAPPPETAGDVASAPPAGTDAVPVGEDPALAAQAAPDSLDAAGATPPTDVPPGGDPAALAAEAPPGGDPSGAAGLDAPPMGDPSAVAANDAPPMGDPTAVTPASTETGPVANSNSMASEPVPADPVNAEPAIQDTSGGSAVAYKVKKGDTLMKIAFEQYGDLYRWKEIYEANRSRIKDPSNVPPGTKLSLNGAGMVTIERNGDQYLIKHGDTLGLISHDVYGTTTKWKKLWENNRQLIKNPNKIYAGFYLYYQPEARMTQDTPTPGDSAANTPKDLPFKNQAANAVKTAANTVKTAITPTPNAMKGPLAPAATATSARVPASK